MREPVARRCCPRRPGLDPFNRKTTAMPDTTPRLYEGMFLMSQAAVSNSLSDCIDLIQGMFDRVEAETLVLRKWEDRKLAYAISGQKRGTYLIAYFKVTPTSVVEIERACNLSEDVLRVLMTRCDHFGEEEMAEIYKEPAEEPEEGAEAEGGDKPAESEASEAAEKKQPAEATADA